MLSKDIQLASTPINWWFKFIPLNKKFRPLPETVLSQVSGLGYTGIEYSGAYGPLPVKPSELKPLLDKYKLKTPSGAFASWLLSKPYNEQEKEYLAFLKVMQELGAPIAYVVEATYYILPSLKTNLFPYRLPFLTPTQWQTLGKGLDQFSKLAADHGIQLGYHQHVGTIIQELWQIERLLEIAPDLRLVVDTAHLALAGIEPLYVIDKYTDKIILYHLKNIRPNVVEHIRTEPIPWSWAWIQGVFTVPGDGGLDFLPIFQKINESEYKGWIVLEAEQDSAKANPYLYANLGKQYVTEMTGWGAPIVKATAVSHKVRHSGHPR